MAYGDPGDQCLSGPPPSGPRAKSYVSRILRLALLAPDIAEAILDGRTDAGLVRKGLERPLPASWEGQRPVFGD